VEFPSAGHFALRTHKLQNQGETKGVISMDQNAVANDQWLVSTQAGRDLPHPNSSVQVAAAGEPVFRKTRPWPASAIGPTSDVAQGVLCAFDQSAHLIVRCRTEVRRRYRLCDLVDDLIRCPPTKRLRASF